VRLVSDHRESDLVFDWRRTSRGRPIHNFYNGGDLANLDYPELDGVSMLAPAHLRFRFRGVTSRECWLASSAKQTLDGSR